MLSYFCSSIPLDYSHPQPSPSESDSSQDRCEMSLCVLKRRDPGCQVIQHNGQRIYIPATSKQMRSPPKGTEVFVGNLPRDLYEDELVPLFGLVGPIYKMRLMMDFTGSTRGYAFVSYFSEEDAIRAVCTLNCSKIRRNTSITVHISVDNCRLFFGNVPKNLTSAEIQLELEGIMDGLVEVIAYSDPRNARLNRGFVFAEFETHAKAAIARRKLLSGIVTLWGETQKVFVDWADPEPMVEPQVLMKVTVLFLKNLPAHFNSHGLKELLQDISGVNIERVYKRCNYAFVHFSTRSEAERAKNKFINDVMFIIPNHVKIEWARPVSYSKKFRLNSPPSNLCLSVPPKQRKMILRSRTRNDRNNNSVGISSPSSGSDSYNASDSETTVTLPSVDTLTQTFSNVRI